MDKGPSCESHGHFVVSAKVSRWAFFAVGLGFLGFLLHRVGIEAIGEAIGRVGYWFSAIVPMNIFWYFTDALGLLIVIRSSWDGRNLSALFLLKVQVCGEALNNATPFMNLGGEPIKGLMLSETIAGRDAISVLIVDNTIKYLATAVFVAMGFALSLFLADLPPSFQCLLGVALGVFALAVTLLAFAQTRGLVARTLSLLSFLPSKLRPPEHLRNSAGSVDTEIARFYRENLTSFFQTFLLHFLSRLLAVADAFFVLWLLGTSPSFSIAVLVVSISILINLCFSFIPLSMGASEGGQYLLFPALGLPPETGVIFALIGRIRGLIWIAIGLGLLALSPFRKLGKRTNS